MRMSRAEQWSGWTAAGCWLASWFLPVVPDYAGWQAFHAAISGPFRASFPVAGDDAIAQVLSALTNVGFVALFWSWWHGHRLRASLFTKLAIFCLVLNLYWLVQMVRAGEARGLLAGYYVWLAAFALLVAAGVLNVVSSRRTSRTPRDGTPA